MANRRVEQTGYQRFEAQTNVGDGLLSVARDGGDLERRVAMGLARLADEFGRRADRQVAHAGMLAGQRDALAGAPEADTVTGGQINGVETTGGAGGGPVRVSVPPSDLRKMIADAAVRHGVDPHALVTTAGIESSFNPRAKNPASSAGGLFQFVDGTARQYGLADRFDPAQASDAAARLMRDNAGHLRKVLGREPNAGELYLAHQQGAGGASKLLANPNARAVDIVGADAVRLNGGDASMTAGQFAAKWTSKAGGGSYNRLPSASSVGPISVTPVREPVKIEPGKAGTWRPSGEDTVYGRAYDVSGTRTYLEMIDLAMEENQAAIFEAYKDDPALLEKALGEGLTADLRDNVFEEIAPDYTVAYRKRATGLMGKARAAQREREEQKNRVDFMDRMEGFTNRQSQLISGYDPNDPNAGQGIVDMQATIDAHWDSAAARGIVTPEAARQFKEASREDTMTGYYLAQLKGKSAEDIAVIQGKIKADYDAGKLAGVSASAWEKIERGAEKAQKDARSQDDLAAKALRERGKDIAERISRGLPVGRDELTKLQLDSATATDGARIVDGSMMRVRVAEALRDQPVGVVEANLWGILTKGGFVPTPDEYDDAVKAVNARRAELKADPLGVAERTGIVPNLGPLPDPATASDDEMAAALNARMLYADVAAERFGVQPKYFRPEEEAALKRGTISLDTAQHASAMKQLDIVSQKLGLLEVERQFGKDATDRLQDWQAKVRYATPAEAEQWLKERNDPQWQERVRPLVSKGESEARKRSADDVVSLLDESGWFSFSAAGPIDNDTRRAMMNDFVRLSGERFAATGDAAQAQEQAIERMRKVWGTTRAFGGRGGRLMLYPPEENYPSIAGSTDWIGEELKELAEGRGLQPENMALVSDGKTKAAVERGEAPGYLLSAVDPDTGMEELVTDEQGRPLRHFFDAKAAQEKAMKAAETARNTRNDPWLVLGRNTAVGPLYLGGADPADLADRQRRIGEIAGAQEQRMNEKRRIREEIRNADIPGMPVPPEEQ